MRTLWNAYFSYDKDPVQTVRGLVENRRFGAAAAGYAAAALCWLVFFWTGAELTAWGVLWRFAFFWLLEMTLGYLWAALSGLFLNFFSGGNGPSALFVVMGLSGFVQGLLLCFALIAAAVPWLKPLAVGAGGGGRVFVRRRGGAFYRFSVLKTSGCNKMLLFRVETMCGNGGLAHRNLLY